ASYPGFVSCTILARSELFTMSPHLEEVVVFTVMSILVGLFAWIYLRDRQKTSGLWMLGWVAILIHFATPVIDDYLHWPPPLFRWIRIATLILSGTCFLLSVSEVFAQKRRRALFGIFIVAASLLYLTGLVSQVRNPWFYVGLLLASSLYGFAQALWFYGGRSPYFYA